MKIIRTFLMLLLVFPIAANAQTENVSYDEIAPFSEGLAAVRIGDRWGFINENAELVIDFRNDLVWTKNADTKKQGVLGIPYPQFKNGRCMIQELKVNDIPFYGFIDKKGETVIAPEYLNITEFDKKVAIGIFVRQAMQGQNEIKLSIVDYIFTEVVLDINGEIIWPIHEREHALTDKRRYKTPELRAKLLHDDLLMFKRDDNKWEIKKLNQYL
ncbi:WG repeat-containing protein [Maribacter polysaccharolyticus]|uniref:WG repeat-containing protein n=1 Tax=Maribacter polysaccharolyticus TaxID=3020831 RepID=UPI00237EFF36|nr:WG repeat-containing protein [Maribacter polysaccharolyticus]MDE3741973.1 WG repeat-containing protein [Maribacter polysaccharolyticus]